MVSANSCRPILVTLITWLLLTATVAAQTPPPKIEYSSRRESKEWVTVDGVQSPVDQGLEFEGKIAYLTMMYKVVVIEAKTKIAIWHDQVGGFWDSIEIINIAKGNEAKRWVIELGSSRKPGVKQRYEFETGKKLELIGGSPTPAGKTIKPRKEWFGSAGKQTNSSYSLVTTAKQWSKLRGELFPEKLTDLPSGQDIDFSREVLLVCYGGKAGNWNGISIELAVEAKDHLLLRLNRHFYQSIGETPPEYPYGVMVLPRLVEKDYVLEFNYQGLINGPPEWKKFLKLKIKE